MGVEWIVFFSSLYFVLGFIAAALLIRGTALDEDDTKGVGPFILLLWPLAIPVVLWVALGTVLYKAAKGGK